MTKNNIYKSAFEYLSHREQEHQIILYETESGSVEIIDTTSESTDESVGFSMDIFISNKEKLQNKTVYIAHNHPSGEIEPSMSDFIAASETESLFRLNGIFLGEELIVTKNDIKAFYPESNDDKTHANAQETPLLKTHIHLFFVPLSNEENTQENRESIIKEYLLNNYEVAYVDNIIYFSEKFSFEELLIITNNIEDVPFFGIPNYETDRIQKRISDIETICGSIEFFSIDKENELLPLKYHLLL